IGTALAPRRRVNHDHSSLRTRLFPFFVLVAALVGLHASPARAESLCDSSFQDCRTPLINLIRAEQVGIDVGFWFMEDQRYVSEIIARKNAGVTVRLIVAPRATPTYPLNETSLNAFANAGIPMMKKV